MPRTRRPYPPEFRAEAARLARGSDRSIPALAADLGVSPEALRHWLRQADADAGRGQPGVLTGDEREGLRRLRRENQVLGQGRGMLRKAAACFAQEAAWAATGSSSGSGPDALSPSSAGPWASPARPTLPGRAARSRPAPGGMRHSPPGSRRRASGAGGATPRRGSAPRCGRRASAPPGGAWRG